MGKRTWAAIALVAAAIAREGLCADPDRLELSVADAIALAMERNATLKAEALNSEMRREDLTRSRAIYEPLLSQSLSAGGSQLRSGSGVSKNGSYLVGVTQLLPTGASLSVAAQSNFYAPYPRFPGNPAYDFSTNLTVSLTQPLQRGAGRQSIESGIESARLGLRDAVERFRLTATDTLLLVVTSYYRLYTLRQSLEARKVSLEDAEKILEETRAQVQAGALQPIDITNSEYGVAQRRKELVDAERSMRDQAANLRYLLGVTTGQELVPTEAPTRIEPEQTQAQAVETALGLRSDLKLLRSALESAQLDERVARNNTRPDLALVATAGLMGVGGTLGQNFEEMEDGRSWWSGGVQLTAPLGNSAAESDYKKAQIRTRQARAELDALAWRVRIDVESDLRALISARLQIQLAEIAREQASARLEEYRNGLQAGTTTARDVLYAESDLYAATSAHLEAIESYADSVMTLWRDTGELLDRLGVHVEASGGKPPPGAGSRLPRLRPSGAIPPRFADRRG